MLCFVPLRSHANKDQMQLVLQIDVHHISNTPHEQHRACYLSRISMLRLFGAPVIEPPGKAERIQSMADLSMRRIPWTVLTI